MTQLTTHFSLREFEASDTAARLGIDNTVPDSVILAEVTKTAEMLERIRAFLCDFFKRDVPIAVTSGYRCERLNRAVGGTTYSDHVKGRAADWRAPSVGTPTDIARLLAARVDQLGIGQLINEFPSLDGRTGWVHTSTATPMAAVNRVITIDKTGTHAGIAGVLV